MTNMSHDVLTHEEEMIRSKVALLLVGKIIPGTTVFLQYIYSITGCTDPPGASRPAGAFHRQWRLLLRPTGSRVGGTPYLPGAGLAALQHMGS